MTQPAAPTAAPATPAPGPTPVAGQTKQTTAKPADAKTAQTPPKESTPEKIRVRGYERAAKVKEKLEAESPSSSDSAGETSTTSPPAAKASPAESGGDETRLEAKAQPAPSHDVDGRVKAAEERRKRIAEVARREREADAEREAKRTSRATEQEVEKLRKRIAELEPHEQVFASEESLLAAAEAKGMSAEKLVSWMRTRLSDPAAVAQRQAKTETERMREALREELRAEMRQEFETREAKFREEREAIERAQKFERLASSKADTHPLTASLLKKHGIDGVARFANEQVLQYLPEGFSPEHLHDVMEEYLAWLVGGDAGPPATPAPGASHPEPKRGADQPVTTLSNALAGERISVTEQVPLHHLPLSERARRLKEKLGRE